MHLEQEHYKEKAMPRMIRSRRVDRCYLCGSTGDMLYHGLRDCLFDAPGEWDVRKCPALQCGLLWLDPMPLEEDVILAYQKYYTHDSAQVDGRVSFRRRISGRLDRYYLSRKYGYGADVYLWMKWAGAYRSFQPLRSARLDFSVMYLPSNAGARLLEVGCGGGETLRTLLDHGWLAEGVDFDPEAVAVARRRGLQVRQGTLEEQHYPDASFDAITMSHLVEHVHDPVKLLAECGRILKPGGSIVVVTPNVSSLGHRFYRSAWRSLDLPRHLHLFTPQALRALAKSAGFGNNKMFSTVRESNNVFLGSRNIERTGRYIWGSTQPRLLKKTAKIMALIERIYIAFSDFVGEELVLIAER